MISGSFRECVAGGERHCTRSTLIARAPGVAHSDAFGPTPTRCFNVEVDATARDIEYAVATDCGAQAWAAVRLLRELRADADDLVVEGLALELVAGALCDSRQTVLSPPRVMRDITEMLRTRFTERVTLRELASHVGLHPMHVTRMFRRAHGVSVGEFVRSRRIELAARELAGTSRPLAEIALSAGFVDQAHLTRVFRKLTRTTPARYRATFRH